MNVEICEAIGVVDPRSSADGESELRPAMLRSYKPATLKCYRRRLAHYERWCSAMGLQPGAEHITSEKVLAYVRDQIGRWDEETEESAPPEYRRLVPDTLRQSINALIYWGERAGQAPDDREAKELARRFKRDWQQPPAWRVPGRRSPRQTRKA